MNAGKWAALAALAWLFVGQAGAKETVPVEAFASSDKMHSPRLSPDGRHIAVAADLGEGNHVIAIYAVQDMQQTAHLRLPRYETPAQMYWVSANRLVVGKGRRFGSLEKPSLMGEIIATDADGKNQKYVYGPQQSTNTAGIDPGFGYIEALPQQPNGHFYMRRLSGSSKRSQLYDIDTERVTSRLVADIPVKDLSFVFDSQAIPRFASGIDDDDQFLLYAADAKGENWEPVPQQQLGGTFMPAMFSPDDQQVFAYFSANDGPVKLVRSDASGKHREVLAEDAFASVGGMELGPSPALPFAVVTGGGKPRTIYFDRNAAEAKRHESLANSFPGRHVTYINHTTDGTRSLLYVYSDRDPGGWYLFDREQRKVSRIMDSRAGIDPARMGERRPFRFRASDGMELDGYLTLPNGVENPAKLSMVLLPHGGPHAPGDEWAFDNDAQFLASRGYLVLQVNFRGSEGRGYAFEQAGFLKWGTRIQDDLLDGVRWALAQGYADPERICAFGASFGAYSAMMVAAREPTMFKCAAGMAGLYDLKMMYRKGDIRTTRFGRNYLARVVGRDDAELEANSPINQAARIKVPVLLIHGENDERTPLAQAKAMKAALERAGNVPEWMTVANEGHGFYKDANNIAFYQRLQSFLDRHIGADARL